jgi:GT2 family glycosyltransferase
MHTDVFGPSGAAGAYRRDVFDDVGLFAERFGSYLEDVDLAWRARLAGWTCTFVPDAVVYHHVSATGGGPLASFHVARNRTWVIARNFPTALLGANFGAILRYQAEQARSAAAAWRGSAARATLRGLAVGWATWPAMLPDRRRIQARRRVPNSVVKRWLEGRT